MRRALLTAVGAAVALSALWLLTLSRGQSQNAQPERAMTEKEKAEAKILYGHRHPNQELDVPLANYRPQDPEITIEHLVMEGQLPAEKRPPDYDCIPIRKADIIVIGVPGDASSHPTPSGKWLFTTHEVEVKEVLKGAPSTPLSPGDRILVSLSGGELLVNYRPVKIIDHSHIRLVPGHHYVLFLKLIPETGDYSTEESDPSFEASDANVAHLRAQLKGCAEAPNAH